MDINDTTYRIVTRAFAISPAFLTYTQEQYGLGNIDGVDDITIQKIYNKTIPFILDELKEMGILLAEGFEIYDSYENLNFILSLREQFCADTLLTILINSDTASNTYNYILESDGQPDIVITDIIESSKELFPLSIQWGQLYEKRYDVINTPAFITHMSSCISMAKEDVANREDNDDDIIAFTKYLMEHKKEVKQYVEHLCDHPLVPVEIDDFNFKYIDAMALLSGNEIKQFLLNLEAGSTLIEVPSVDLHHSAHEYYFQYYIVNDVITEPSDLQICKLVVEHINSSLTLQENIDMFKNLCSIVKFTDSTVEKLVKYLTIAMQ